MKRKSLIIVGLMATVAMAQSPVSIRRDLKTGSTDVYTVVTESKNSFETPAGSQEMGSNISMTLEFEAKASDAELADLIILSKDLKMEMTGPMAEMGQAPEMPKEIKSVGKIDARNRISSMKVENAPTGMAGIMMNSGGGSTWMTMFVEYPEKEINVGDSWDVKIPPLPMMTDKESTLKATLKGEKDGAWWVQVAGDIPIAMDSSKMAGAADSGMTFTMSGTNALTNDVLIEKGTGRTLNVTSTMKMKANMEVSGMMIPMAGSTKSTLTLKK